MTTKKLPVVELILPDMLDDESGLDAIAFVDNPAIEYTWQYFTKETFVNPRKGEKEADYISRCIAYQVGEGKDQDQAAAICYSTWKNEGMEGVIVEAPPYVDEVGYSKKKNEKNVYKAFQKLLGILGENVKKKFSKIENADNKIGVNHHGSSITVNYLFGSKLYTPEEVYEMNNILQPFMTGDKDIFTFDSNWKEVTYTVSGNNVTIISTRDVVESEKVAQKFYFASDDKRLIVAPVMVPNKLIYRRDPDGTEYNCYFSEQTIQQLLEKYMMQSRQNDSNIMHDPNKPNKVTMIESWIVNDPKMDKAAVYHFNVPSGTWMTIMRVNDDETWKMIKEGKLQGLSVEGLFGVVKKK